MKKIIGPVAVAALLLSLPVASFGATSATNSWMEQSSPSAAANDDAREKLKAQQKDQRDKLKAQQKDQRDKLKVAQKDQRDKLAAELKLQRDKLHADQRAQWEKLRQQTSSDDTNGGATRSTIASSRR